MHDAIDVFDDLFDLREIGEIGFHELGAGREIRGPREVAPANLRINAGEKLAETGADATGRAGH